MLIADNWNDYECLDMGHGYKIERFGKFLFKRPEPLATGRLTSRGLKFDGAYIDKKWVAPNLPQEWAINYKDMRFMLSPSEFKHLGIFPEQAVNWDFIRAAGERHEKPLRVLNLFGYTGAATIAAAMGNVEEVVHIDALKSAINRTQENIKLNHLEDKTIRTIVDDVLKFIQREKRRGRTYHAIIMDPPSFGRGPNKETWKIDEKIDELIEGCLDIFDEEGVYLILNTYTADMSHQKALTILKNKFRNKNITHGHFDSHQIGVNVTSRNKNLLLGKTTRWCIYEDLLKD